MNSNAATRTRQIVLLLALSCWTELDRGENPKHSEKDKGQELCDEEWRF